MKDVYAMIFHYSSNQVQVYSSNWAIPSLVHRGQAGLVHIHRPIGPLGVTTGVHKIALFLIQQKESISEKIDL